MSSNSLSNVNITRWSDLYSTLRGSSLLPLSSVMKTWPGVSADETVTIGTKKTDNLMSSALNSAWILQWEPHCKIVIGFINRLFNHCAFSVCGREQGTERPVWSEWAPSECWRTPSQCAGLQLWSRRSKKVAGGVHKWLWTVPKHHLKAKQNLGPGKLICLRLPGTHKTIAVRAATCGQPRCASISVGSFRYPVSLHWQWCAPDT